MTLDLKQNILDVAAATPPADYNALEADMSEEDPDASAPVMVSMADVDATIVQWLWPERMALGKISLLAGDPGLGKSFLTLDLAARVSQGTARWPDGSENPNGPASVVLLSAEDDPSDTIRPRLDAAGADVSKIMSLAAVKDKDRERGFSLEADLEHLEKTISDLGDCRLVVIDPISAYLGGIDSHKNADVRGLLAPLAKLAADHGVAVLAVSHLRKGEGQALYRVLGSMAFVAAARAAYVVLRDKDDPTGERRLLLPLKNNLGNDKTGMAYRLDPESSFNGMPVVAWEPDSVTITADEAMQPHAQPGPNPEAREEAADWVTSYLQEHGPTPAKTIFAAAKADGISTTSTLKRAKSDLQVQSVRRGDEWVWMPPAPAKEELDALDASDSIPAAYQEGQPPGNLRLFDQNQRPDALDTGGVS
jgi:putative DNA primase/helicase